MQLLRLRVVFGCVCVCVFVCLQMSVSEFEITAAPTRGEEPAIAVKLHATCTCAMT